MTTLAPPVTIPATITMSMEITASDLTYEIFSAIQAAYGLPSVIFMVFFFCFLFRKTYSNSFYRLVQLDLLVNLLCYFNSWFAVRIDKHPFAIPYLKALTYVFPKFLTWTRYFAYWFMHMQFVSGISLSVHRLTSVYFHATYEKMWNRCFPVYCLFCMLYCYLCNELIPGKITEVYILNGQLTKTNYMYVILRAMDLTAYFGATYFVFLFVVGMLTSRMVTKKIQAASFSNGSIGKKLTKIAVTYASIYSGIMLWTVISALNTNFHFLPEMVAKISANLLPFASDMMTLALPYILMAYDTNIRKDLFNKVPASQVNSRVVSSSFVITR
ncbi:CBN-SRG-58 protein [Caenorhabditis brenneri]|uniref:Serpentine receptor class gamma n=1 Tax=Caenorhabditis brenneri TaxID=135651 RepID=G0MT40_CAEBE|nr:CBN-SRG-58 protein [Caenorhabditis brenneri]